MRFFKKIFGDNSGNNSPVKMATGDAFLNFLAERETEFQKNNGNKEEQNKIVRTVVGTHEFSLCAVQCSLGSGGFGTSNPVIANWMDRARAIEHKENDGNCLVM